MDSASTTPTKPDDTRTPLRPRSLLRSVLVVGLIAVALVVFTFLLGDVRRRHIVLAQAERYTDELQSRVFAPGLLPLNLEIEIPPHLRTRAYAAKFLSRQDAHTLRGTDRRIIAAYTVPIARTLAPDGRGVVFFEEGRFATDWLTLDEFDRLAAEQAEVLVRLRANRANSDMAGP